MLASPAMSTEEKEINAMVVRALFANVQRYIYVAEVWYVEDKKDEEANDEAPPREHPDRKEAILFMAEDRMSGGGLRHSLHRPDRQTPQTETA